MHEAVPSYVADDTSIREVEDGEEEGDAEADEMWDMDWSALASGKGPERNANLDLPNRQAMPEVEDLPG